MLSTWMTPLVKAQHAHRQSHSKVPAILKCQRPSDMPADIEPAEQDPAINQRVERSQRRWDSLDLNEFADWGGDPSETLPEIEREIGLSEWIDPETGRPPEGQSPPHLEIE